MTNIPRPRRPGVAPSRRAALPTAPAAPRRRNIATRSALLTGLLWRAALITGGPLPSFLPAERANNLFCYCMEKISMVITGRSSSHIFRKQVTG